MTVRVVLPGILVTLFVLAGCATLPESSRSVRSVSMRTEEPASARAADAEVSELQMRIAEAAKSFVGGNPEMLYVRDREFRCDCTGVVLAAYYKAGIDLMPEFVKEQGNGVARLHAVAERHNLTTRTAMPRPGDIVFWDNTYDHDADGAWGDELTHAGIVVDVQPDGRITYVHHNYRRGVVVAYMSLKDPETYQIQKDGRTVTLNSPMRMKSHRYIKPDAWLSSHLFRSFGRLSRLPDRSS